MTTPWGRVIRNIRKYIFARRDNSAPKSVILVSGVQRSGTNMIMDFYDRSLETTIFYETDKRVYESYHLRTWPELKRNIAVSPSRIVALKALLEAHELSSLLDAFAPAKLVWIFRPYDDMVNSYMQNWPGGRNEIDKVIKDPDSAAWRGKGMTAETHAILKRHYDPAMNNASALALFWYYRNQLIFDQSLHDDNRCKLVFYDDLVGLPETCGRNLAEFSGLVPDSRLWSGFHWSSVRRRPPPDIAPEIRRLNDQMLEKLLHAYSASTSRPMMHRPTR